MCLKELDKLAKDSKDLTKREMSLCRRFYLLGGFLGILLGILAFDIFWELMGVI